MQRILAETMPGILLLCIICYSGGRTRHTISIIRHGDFRICGNLKSTRTELDGQWETHTAGVTVTGETRL